MNAPQRVAWALGLACTAAQAQFTVTPTLLRSVPPNFPLTVEAQVVHTGTIPTLYTLYITENGAQIPTRTTTNLRMKGTFLYETRPAKGANHA